jgi:hypothetical protein
LPKGIRDIHSNEKFIFNKQHQATRELGRIATDTGASVIASQSRQENFSRTCSIIFQRRGFDTTSPSLCSRSLPHLPHRGNFVTMRF